MTTARHPLAWLNDLETIVCEVLLAVFVLLLFAQILARQLFGYSIAWSEELSTYMFVWFAYLGAVVAAKMSAHNRVSFHLQFVPKPVATAMLTLADLLWVAFNVYFVWLSWDFIFHRMNLFWKSQTLGLPMKYFYMVLPLAFTLMTVRILWNMVLRLRGVEMLDPEQEEIEKLKREAARQAAGQA